MELVLLPMLTPENCAIGFAVSYGVVRQPFYVQR